MYLDLDADPSISGITRLVYLRVLRLAITTQHPLRLHYTDLERSLADWSVSPSRRTIKNSLEVLSNKCWLTTEQLPNRCRSTVLITINDFNEIYAISAKQLPNHGAEQVPIDCQTELWKTPQVQKPLRARARIGEESRDLEERREGPPLYPPIGGKRRVSKNEYSEAFLSWFSGYPRKEGKVQAMKAWNRRGLDSHLEEQRQSLAERTAYLMRKGVEYCPLPATYLNDHRDEADTHRQLALSSNGQPSKPICGRCQKVIDESGVPCTWNEVGWLELGRVCSACFDLCSKERKERQRDAGI